MRPFLVCIHDASPVHARETRVMIGDLAPLVGRGLSFGVVPDWHGEWPLASHPEYCRLIHQNSGEVLLHGYVHRRQRGAGPVTWLAEGSDEMNGLGREQTRRLLERGQAALAGAFGQPARCFLPPAWQRGQVPAAIGDATGLEHVLGFFSLTSAAGRSVPLATWTWDCGRWSWLGHVGHGIGRLLQSLDGRVPALAIHPRDLERGYWPQIVRLTRELLECGHTPVTVSGLLEARDAALAL